MKFADVELFDTFIWASTLWIKLPVIHCYPDNDYNCCAIDSIDGYGFMQDDYDVLPGDIDAM